MPEGEYEGCEEPALGSSDKCICHKPDRDEEEAKGLTIINVEVIYSA